MFHVTQDTDIVIAPILIVSRGEGRPIAGYHVETGVGSPAEFVQAGFDILVVLGD